MSLTPLEDNPQLIHHCVGAVVNKANEHWVALRSVHGRVWLLDSLKDSPQMLTADAYAHFITECRSSYPITFA